MISLEAVKERTRNLVQRLMPDWQQELLVAMGAQDSLIERDPKYIKITNILFILSTFSPLDRIVPTRPVGIAPGAFVAYHFCRIMDDIADGDRELPERYGSFSDMKDELEDAMNNGKYPDTDIGILLRGTMHDIRKYRGVDIRKDISQFLDAMAYENERRLKKVISTRSELHQLYQASFGVPQDISFIAMGSRVRSVDIPELAEVQGRLYAVRDLSDELSKGIIFVPREVLPHNMGADELCSSYQTLPEIDVWKQEELVRGRQLIDRLRQRKLDWRGRRIVNFLAKGINKYICQTSVENNLQAV